MDTQTTINQRFAKVVDELLSRKKIDSQTDLAKKLGYKSKSSITGIINGSQNPSIENIADLRTLFGVSINYMVRDELPVFVADRKTPSGDVVDDVKSYTKEELEQIRLHASGGVSLLDEFSLRVIGFTLWEAFLLGKLDKLEENVDDKVMYCKRYAESYYKIRLRERFSQPTVEG